MQFTAYFAATKILPFKQINLEGCKQAKIAYNASELEDKTNNIYEDSGLAYAICFGIGKSSFFA